jgi:hypothetical protein
MRTSLRLAVLIVLIALVAGVQAAYAGPSGVSWCEEDPILDIGNRRVNIITRVPIDKLDKLQGAVQILATIPYGHPPVKVTYTAYGYFTEEVTLRDGKTRWDPNGRNTIIVSTMVNASESFPVQIVIEADGRKTVQDGFSNEPLEAKHVVKQPALR